MAEKPYSSFSSRIIPLPAENIDTDQIVPARFLKVTDKDGLADALFRDWRFEADGGLKEPTFVLDKPQMAGRQILLALVLFLFYGSLLWGVLPSDPSVSWQAHLFGAIGGLIAASWVAKADRPGAPTLRA